MSTESYMYTNPCQSSVWFLSCWYSINSQQATTYMYTTPLEH